MKASALLKHNIYALLQARRQTKHDLAQWCRRSDAWINKILGKDNRNVPLEYLDRIADFFGLSAYQLFQPGISPLLERRKADRRSGKDRRLAAMNMRVRETLSTAIANLSAEDVADVIRLKTLSEASRETLRQAAQQLARSEPQTGAPRRRRKHAGPGPDHSTDAEVRHAPQRGHGAGPSE
jgi:hypothetical protein